jgi:hypothetical protein
MKQKMLVTVACSMTCGQSQVLSAGSHFLFTGKHGINVDLEDPSNPLEYLELFCTPEIAEVTARETNRYVQNFKKTHLI